MSSLSPHHSFLRHGAVAVLTILGFTGCQSMNTPFQKSMPGDDVSAVIEKASTELAETNGRIDGAIRSLDELVNHPSADLRQQYNALGAAVKSLDESSENLRKATDEIQTKGQAYFISWDRELAGIRDENLRKRSADRRADVAERLDAIRNRSIAARERLAPLVRRLNEVRAALEVDLTPGGVNAVRPTIDDVRNLAGPPRDGLRDLAEELRRAAVALAPAASDARSR